MALLRSERNLVGKGEFVRYISHEIRTPLNTVLLGLLYLAKKLPELTNIVGDPAAVVTECLGIVEDLNISSNNALEVLNEFLTFDKLETGSLLLDCSEFPVMVFVEDSIKPFYLQVHPSHLLYCTSSGV